MSHGELTQCCGLREDVQMSPMQDVEDAGGVDAHISELSHILGARNVRNFSVAGTPLIGSAAPRRAPSLAIHARFARNMG